jgi:RNA polymerase-binding transcription factor DksA
MEEKLLARRRAISTVLDHLKRENELVTGERHFDWLDQAWDNNAARTVDSLINLYRDELENIAGALASIREGTFGFCAACHEPINDSRLDIFPYARFCASCAEFRESVACAT